MAFVLNCNLGHMEFRVLRSGKGRESGKVWMSLVLEDQDSQQVEVSVPADYQSDVYGLGLRKGDIVSLSVRAVARNDGNSYIQLTEVPVLLVDADGVVQE